MNANVPPTSATQAKERLYAQLAGSMGRMTRAMGRTADLCEQMQVDLYAMKTFASLEASKWVFIHLFILLRTCLVSSVLISFGRFMTVVEQLNAEVDAEAEVDGGVRGVSVVEE